MTFSEYLTTNQLIKDADLSQFTFLTATERDIIQTRLRLFNGGFTLITSDPVTMYDATLNTLHVANYSLTEYKKTLVDTLDMLNDVNLSRVTAETTVLGIDGTTTIKDNKTGTNTGSSTSTNNSTGKGTNTTNTFDDMTLNDTSGSSMTDSSTGEVDSEVRTTDVTDRTDKVSRTDDKDLDRTETEKGYNSSMANKIPLIREIIDDNFIQKVIDLIVGSLCVGVFTME